MNNEAGLWNENELDDATPLAILRDGDTPVRTTWGEFNAHNLDMGLDDLRDIELALLDGREAQVGGGAWEQSTIRRVEV